MKYQFFQSYSGSEYAPHIYRHDVVESEVHAILARRAEDVPAFDGARMALGQIEPGERYLRVIYVPNPAADSVFVLTASSLRGVALTTCRHRQRGQGQHRHSSNRREAMVTVKSGKQEFPPGWDQKRIERVIDYYETQEWAGHVLEVEAAIQDRQEE